MTEDPSLVLPVGDFSIFSAACSMGAPGLVKLEDWHPWLRLLAATQAFGKTSGAGSRPSLIVLGIAAASDSESPQCLFLGPQ